MWVVTGLVCGLTSSNAYLLPTGSLLPTNSHCFHPDNIELCVHGHSKLDAVAQSRYLEQLQLLGLKEKDDPYEASNSYNSSTVSTTACYDHVHTILWFFT